MLFQPLLANLIYVLSTAALLMLLPAHVNLGPLGSLPALADDDDESDDDDDDGPRAVRRAPALPDYAPDEILLINASDAALSKAVELGLNIYSTEVIRGSQLTISRLRLPPGLDAPSALEALRRETPGQAADLNHFYRLQQAAEVSGNPYACTSSRCYGQRMINWTREIAACGDGIKIGIIDTGVDVSHPSLSGQPVKNVSFAAPLTRPSSTQHGTAVAALLAGKGGREIQGLVPKARVYAADVFHVSAAGQLTADAVSIARAIGWLKEQGVSVINISLSGSENRILEQAVKDALAAKISVVAAAGNDGRKRRLVTLPRYPASSPSRRSMKSCGLTAEPPKGRTSPMRPPA
ncbi:MAG: S8 family serine peptidase [Chitinophagales bacterium]|nr:S8 family serine peptidase [Hyphomicrobiales bacterium]